MLGLLSLLLVLYMRLGMDRAINDMIAYTNQNLLSCTA